MFDFNPNQLEALDLSRHVVLTAAAGSGKTSILVERFLRILERNCFRPEQIVAITFTEAAAAEMRQRIAQAVQQRALTYSASPPNPWSALLPQLARASITTIHGFCLRILQPNFESVGFAPDTRLLSPVEQPVLLFECIDEFLAEAAGRNDPDLAVALQTLSLDSIRDCLTGLVDSRNSFNEIAEAEPGFSRLFEGYRDEASHWILQSSEWALLEEALEKLPEMLLRAPGTMSRRCRDQLAGIRKRQQVSDREVVQEVVETLRQRYSPSKIWKESAWREPVVEAWNGLRAVLARHPLVFEEPDPNSRACLKESLAAVKKLYGRALEVYTARKAQLGAIDFEDILDQTRNLLRSPEQRRKLRRRYPYLLVDEFQDTNQIQWEILRSLIGPESNFMAVGDDKQSIYRFRQADVAVFQAVRRWGKERGRSVEMPENYRAGRSLVEFTNQVFRRLFRGGPDYEATHQEMEPAGAHRPEGKVESFFCEPDDPTPEATRVADWIGHLLRQGRSASEMAILLRTRNRLKLYEEALAAKGIRFSTVSGAGFYESQEVLDCIVLLRWLANPRLDVELVGLLRSPFFNLSDEDLVRLSQSAGEAWLEKLHNAGASISDSRKLAFARRVLRALLADAGKGTLPSQLLSLAFRLTGYEQIRVASSRAAVRLGNLEKFQRTVAQFESRRSHSLRVLLRFLDGVLRSGVSEPEATLPTHREEEVRIYTIHGAKGLEFPVVILPELGQPFSVAPTSPYFLLAAPDHRQAYLGLLIRNPYDQYRELHHPLYRVLQKLDDYRKLAEEKRLLYVAMTRAQEQLLLLGRHTPAESYAGWLLACGAERFRVEPDFLESGKETPHHRPLQFLREESVACVEPPLRVGAEPAPVLAHETWSPTQIAAWLACPRRFYLSEVEGIPDKAELSLQVGVSEAEGIGTIVHQALEASPALDDWPRVEALAARGASRLASSDPGTQQELLKEILGHLQRTRDHPLLERLRNASRVFSEQKFLRHWRGKRIEGAVDKLFQERSGNWSVLDFKTNFPGRPFNQQSFQLTQARSQLLIYLWAVSGILSPAKPRLEGLLLYTATGDVDRIGCSEARRVEVEGWLERLPADQGRDGFPKTRHPERCEACPFLANHHCSGAQVIQQSLWQ